MNERELIEQCRNLLDNAEGCLGAYNHEDYCAGMSELLDLLIVELVGDAPGVTQSPVNNITS